MRTLLGMQYGGNIQQQYPRRQLQLQPQSFQEGGGVPSAYKTSFGFDSPISPALASLMRGEKKREAFEEARTAELSEMQKQKRSGLFGSIGGLGGGLLASTALGALGFTPAGIPLALAAGLGTGLGKAFGSKVGYEGGYEPGVMFRKAKSEKAKDMMYGKQAGLEDIERAGRDYTAGIDTAAGVAGLKAGLTAGFAPEGGVYGKAGKFGRGTRAPGAAIQSSLGLSEAPTSLTGGAPTLQLPKARTAIAGTESGLTGLTGGIPETLGNIPSIPSAVSDVGAGALLEGGAEALTGGAGDALSAYTGTAAQNRALLEAGNYEGVSIIDALKQAGLDSSKLSRQNMWQNLFAPQIAGLMGGGMIKQNPQSLLGYLG
jgi:hypothetical protein